MKQKGKKIGDFVIKMEQLLGKGSFATTHKAFRDKNYNEPYACKIINKQDVQKVLQLNFQYFVKRIQEEYKALRSLKHPNIVEMFDVEETKNNLYLFFEYCEQDLEQYIRQHLFNINYEEVMIFSKQIIEACHYYTSKGYLHRDIKPANILLKNKMIKVADFGLATEMVDYEKSVTYAGSPHYMAPQILKVQSLKLKQIQKCDVWSVGVTLYQLATGMLPYGISKKDLSDQKIVEKIDKNLLEVKIQWNQVLKEIVTQMLEINPLKRLSFEEANKMMSSVMK